MSNIAFPATAPVFWHRWPESGDGETSGLAPRVATQCFRVREWSHVWSSSALNDVDLPRVRVATWLTPRERGQVDDAGDGYLTTIHAPTFAIARRLIETGRVDALVLSAELMRAEMVDDVRRLVQEAPCTLVAGLVTDDSSPLALSGIFFLGSAGIATLIDARQAEGWSHLRSTLSVVPRADAFMRSALTTVLNDVMPEHDEVEPDGSRPTGTLVSFMRTVFTSGMWNARALARSLGTRPSTLTCRFFRASLPSPKRYLVNARLIHLAHLGESPALSVASIANLLDASSPQSLGRSVRIATGLTATAFRERYTGRSMLDRFRSELIFPYLDALRCFDPIMGAAWKAEHASARARRGPSHVAEGGTECEPDASLCSTDESRPSDAQPLSSPAPLGRPVCAVAAYRRRFRRLHTLRLVRESSFAAPEDSSWPRLPIRNPREVFCLMAPYAAREVVEAFWILPLDAQHRLVGAGPTIISRGILNASLVHPREVFSAAIVAMSAAIILVHNHPSGDPAPSPQDRAVTDQLVAAGRLLDIPVHDHVVIGRGAFVSFAESGLL